VKDSAATAPASATPFPICPNRLNTVCFIFIALSLSNLKFDTPDIGSRRWIATPESPPPSFLRFPLRSRL
ncbi:MAG: hypothetical protein WCA23_00635, partial [Stellaceae bacterium]